MSALFEEEKKNDTGGRYAGCYATTDHFRAKSKKGFSK